MNKDTVKNIILASFEELGNEEIIDEDMDLLDAGIMDSLTIMFLISELEENLNLHIPIHEVTEESFKSVRSIIKYIFDKMEKL